jgi:hypothetical protein
LEWVLAHNLEVVGECIGNVLGLGTRNMGLVENEVQLGQ